MTIKNLFTIIISLFVLIGLVCAGGIDSDTKLMLHMDGSSGSTIFIDDSSAEHTAQV